MVDYEGMFNMCVLSYCLFTEVLYCDYKVGVIIVKINVAKLLIELTFQLR